MHPDLEVDTGAVRSAAAAMDDLAARVTGGESESPAPVTTPRWATSDAAATAAEASRRRLVSDGADIAATARQIVAAVLDYEDSDERAAARLRGAA
jgi:hypothetical protein